MARPRYDDSMKRFADLVEVPAISRTNEHGGEGAIEFRRLLCAPDFSTPIDFVDFTIIPPGSTIGRHYHHGNEEIYFVVAGSPLICVDGEERRAGRGTAAVVRTGQWHQLINDTPHDVEILVVQVRQAVSAKGACHEKH
jgi:mannose-6-phosphate isomerase-like protein (cupin superfamily)